MIPHTGVIILYIYKAIKKNFQCSSGLAELPFGNSDNHLQKFAVALQYC